MHARMVTAQVSPFKMDEGVRVYREQVVPEAMKLKGFRKGIIYNDTQTTFSPPTR